MVTMLVRLKVQPGKQAEVEEVVKKIAATVEASEPGVVGYLFHRSQQDPSEITILEVYKDQASFDAHMATPHVGQFMARMAELFDMSAVKADRLERIAGFTR